MNAMTIELARSAGLPMRRQERQHLLDTLEQFMPRAELETMRANMRGEERDFFIDKAREMVARIQSMPTTYQTDGQGMKATGHLHYFRGNADWHITELDSDPDGEGQVQAFGLANLGHGAELGYISIKELIAAGVELDLHWTPKALDQIK